MSAVLRRPRPAHVSFVSLLISLLFSLLLIMCTRHVLCLHAWSYMAGNYTPLYNVSCIELMGGGSACNAITLLLTCHRNTITLVCKYAAYISSATLDSVKFYKKHFHSSTNYSNTLRAPPTGYGPRIAYPLTSIAPLNHSRQGSLLPPVTLAPRQILSGVACSITTPSRRSNI